MSEHDLLNTANSWSIAQQYLKLLGPIPSSIGNAVKNLWQDHLLSTEKNEVQISFASNSALRLIDKSSVLKMPLYFAAQALFPDRFSQIKEDDATKALVKILHPGLFASFLSLVYLHRRYNKICNAEIWSDLSKEYVLHSELGFLIGSNASQITPAVGALAGGIRCASLAIFLRHDPVGYKEYRSRFSNYDLFAENKQWGCDHGQIGALIIKAIGIYSEHQVIAAALRGHANQQLPPEFKAFRTVCLIIDAIKQQQPIQDIKLPKDALSLSSTELSNINNSVSDLLTKGSNFNWMLRSSKDDE